MPDTLEPAGGGRYPADMESRVTALEHIARTTAATLERLERRFETIDRRFDVFDRRFEAIDRRLDVFDRRFEAIDRRIDSLTSEHRADFRWLLGIMLGGFTAMLGGFAAMLGVMAHGFHWL
jgi:hypothetical protein